MKVNTKRDRVTRRNKRRKEAISQKLNSVLSTTRENSRRKSLFSSMHKNYSLPLLYK